MRAALTHMGLPQSRAELLARAQSLAGRTIAEVAAQVGVAVPLDLKRAKGFIGRLAESVTGAPGSTRAAPDFEHLGVELKTIPMSRNAVPRESTFVCTIDLRAITSTQWSNSALRRKLSCVLWVPIESSAELRLSERRFGTPLLWEMDAQDDALLRSDWELLVETICRDDLDRIDARIGRYLQVRPKGANGAERVRAADRDDVPVLALPRGFYLRRTFTERLFAHHASSGSRRDHAT